MITSERLNERGAGKLPGHLGIVIAEVSGRVIATLAMEAHHMAPNAYLHAGTVVTLADTAAGYGCISNLPKGASSFTTIELKSNFLGTAREGTLECTARPKHAGRTTQVWGATVVAPRKGGRRSRCFAGAARDLSERGAVGTRIAGDIPRRHGRSAADSAMQPPAVLAFPIKRERRAWNELQHDTGGRSGAAF